MVDNMVKLHEKIEEEYFDRWKKIYKTEKRIHMAISLIKQDGKILDIGSRWGDVTNEIYKHNKNVEGVECVLKFVNMSNKTYPHIHFREGSVLSLPFKNNSFDTVFMGEVIEHVLNQDNAIREVYRVLKPSGEFILTTPNIASLRCRAKLLLGQAIDTDIVHVRLLTKKQLIRLLEKNGFKIKIIKGDNIRISKLKFPCFYKNFTDIFIIKAIKNDKER